MTRPLVRNFVSYPKSGRTWIRYALSNLGVEGGVQFHHDGFEFNDGAMPPHDFDLRTRLERYADVDRLVYLERDPRDVMVSLYFQVTGRFKDFFNYEGDLSQFIRDDYFGAENLERFRQLWAEIVANRKFLAISYEECHQNMAESLRRMLAYYEFPVDEQRLANAVEDSDFAHMQRIEALGTFPHPWLRPRQGSLKVRQGRMGGFRDILAAEDIRYLNDVFALSD
jgi:hypothetical protein